eukprot:Pgem_evm1s9103
MFALTKCFSDMNMFEDKKCNEAKKLFFSLEVIPKKIIEKNVYYSTPKPVKGVSFEPKVYVATTYSPNEYPDRKGVQTNPENLTAQEIRTELDRYKITEMPVHAKSRHRTLIYKLQALRKKNYNLKKQKFLKRQSIKNQEYCEQIVEYCRLLFAGKIKNESLLEYLITYEDCDMDYNLLPIKYPIVMGPELYFAFTLESKYMTNTSSLSSTPYTKT